jgi:endonuclease/exonuclease/phosphatase family metal-dependent hydrolase
MKKMYLLMLLLATLVQAAFAEPLRLNVMSFNIRYDSSEDGENNWQYRKDIVAQTIMSCDADVVGTQEVLHSQLNDLKARLPDYTSIGVGRLDGIEQGEYSAILYKNARFSAVKSGWFWLSETPEKAGSKGWDGACERIATWAILQDRGTQRQFFVINTHLDHVGQMARREGVALLLKRTGELSRGLPIIMTGDFNATPESAVIQLVTAADEPNHLGHTKDAAQETTGTGWTFHGFGRVPENERSFIDYVFVSQGIKVLKHSVIPEKAGGKFISDHSAVAAQIAIVQTGT